MPARMAHRNLLAPEYPRGATPAPLEMVARAYTHSTDYGPGKPTVGGVLHNTVGNTPITTAQSTGSWHYLIDRDPKGTIYRDVPITLAPWHVAATGNNATSKAITQWRPSWMLKAPGGRTSDANYCCIGIELVSLAGGTMPSGYLPYTDSQYVSLKKLLNYLTVSWGPIPWVGHGQLQTNRADPVRLDWERAGFGPMIPNVGRVWIGDVAPVPEGIPMDTTPEERQQMKPDFEGAGLGVNMETAIMKRAALSYKRDEWRGPAVSDEYPALSPSGKAVVRQNFSAGVAEYQPDTGEVLWVEVITHPI
jgi:hypothetical protein